MPPAMITFFAKPTWRRNVLVMRLRVHRNRRTWRGLLGELYGDGRWNDDQLRRRVAVAKAIVLLDWRRRWIVGYKRTRTHGFLRATHLICCASTLHLSNQRWCTCRMAHAATARSLLPTFLGDLREVTGRLTGVLFASRKRSRS